MATQQNISDLRAAHQVAQVVLTSLISSKYPGHDEWDWYKALEAVRQGDRSVWRCFADEKRDVAMAADADVAAAHDDLIRKLHAVYLLRDGPRGVLGVRQ